MYPLEATANESHAVITDIDSSGDSTKESASQPSAEQPGIRSLRKAAVRARERVSEWASILRVPPENVAK